MCEFCIVNYALAYVIVKQIKYLFQHPGICDTKMHSLYFLNLRRGGSPLPKHGQAGQTQYVFGLLVHSPNDGADMRGMQCKIIILH